MSARKKKIVIPSEDEVARYGGDASPGAEAKGDKPTDEMVAPPESQAPADAEPAVEVDAAGDAEQWKDKFLRAKADLANFQRRAEKDRSDALRYANAGLVKALLPILDDLERVIASGAEHASDVEAMVHGATLTLENFRKVLKDFSVSRIEADGQAFDPTVHEAMMQQPSDEHEVPTVIQEVAKGYKLHDRVLRPARVIVSKPTESGPASGGGEVSEDQDASGNE